MSNLVVLNKEVTKYLWGLQDKTWIPLVTLSINDTSRLNEINNEVLGAISGQIEGGAVQMGNIMFFVDSFDAFKVE